MEKLNLIVNSLSDELQQQPLIQALIEFVKLQNQQIQDQNQQIQDQSRQIQALTEKVSKLETENQELKDELNRLRKTPKKPKLAPNIIEPRQRANIVKEQKPILKPASTIKKEQVEIKIAAKDVPKGSRFKGYQLFKVQDLEIIAKEITYKLEVWQTPNSEVIRAQLPKELKGKHFGPTLQALTTYLYQEGLSQPALHRFLKDMNIEISSGQVNNVLLGETGAYNQVREAILEQGLKEAPYIRTDDTGARHKHKNGYCTHIGGKYFAYYKTTFSKSRANFLDILLQGKEGYSINDAMIRHLSQQGVKDSYLHLFEEYNGKKFISKKGLHQLLNMLDIKQKKLRSQCIEASTIGYISTNIVKKDQVLLSDRAGQFAILNHAACWVHMERPLRKIKESCPEVEQELKQVRESIWQIYNEVKKALLAETEDFTKCKQSILHKYDALLQMKSISPAINEVIDNFREYKAEMLKALDYPELPLHNNDSERDIRPMVKRRNISGSTKSDQGKDFRDGLLSLKQTCFRLGYNFWDYLLHWFQGTAPNLAELVRIQYLTHLT